MKSSRKSAGYFIFLILLGAVSGTFIGDVLGNNIKTLQFLKHTYTIGIAEPILLNLKVVSITFAINFYINIMSIVGVILAIIIYRNY